MAKRTAWRGHEGTAAERGYGWAWQKTRERIMQRDCGLCQVCAKQGRVTVAAEVDHIVNKKAGGSEEDSNLQAICEPCHDVKSEAEKLAGMGAKARPLVTIGLDGWPK